MGVGLVGYSPLFDVCAYRQNYLWRGVALAKAVDEK